MALSNIRAKSINILTESSLQAQACKLKYPIVRDQMLNDMGWQFSHKIEPLALLVEEIFNWAYAYQYPSDCHQINRLVGAYEELSGEVDASQLVSQLRDDQLRTRDELRHQIPYEIFNVAGNLVIGSNEPDLRIDYRAEITDPNLFSPPFVLALSHLLASEIAIPIVGAETGRGLRSDSLQLYKQYFAGALSSDMNEQYHPPGDSEYVNIRR